MIDKNRVRMTGENSFLRRAESADGPHTCESSHWRVVLSHLGRSHALFHKDVLGDNEPRIYADNIALGRWQPNARIR